MKNAHFLVFLGLLAACQARPETGYSYPQPQQQPLQLSQSQSSSSFQQRLPEINTNAVPPSQQFSLSQSQQSSSYQESQPQFANQLSSLPAPAVAQAPLPQLQQVNFGPIPQQQLQQIAPVPLPQANFAAPQLFQVPPQGGQFVNFDTPQNFIRLPVQPQGQILIPNLVVSQVQQNPLTGITTYNQLPDGLSQQFQTSFVQQPQLALQQEALVTKNVYVHVAPEDPPQAPQIISAPPPRKNYKIIFIKAPSQATSQRQVILPPAQQVVEEKTLVYVLVDKPKQPQIVVPAPAPTQPSKPEVYFIKYKANRGEAASAAPIINDSNSPSSSLPIVEDVRTPQNQEQQIRSGESTSSLFSGGLPGLTAKYGPPDYQKRNV